MNHLLVSIPIGLGIGFLAQRSRMCFVGGIRDYILVRDTVLLRGFLAFIATAWILYSLLFALGVINPRAPLGGAPRPGVSAGAQPQSTAAAAAERETRGAQPVLLRIFTLPPRITLLSLQFLIGGFALGFLSVMANGCPLRQHILAAQGNLDSLAYLLGFYGGVVFYDFVLSRFVFLVFRFG